jgi:hypothetical protein
MKQATRACFTTDEQRQVKLVDHNDTYIHAVSEFNAVYCSAELVV